MVSEVCLFYLDIIVFSLPLNVADHVKSNPNQTQSRSPIVARLPFSLGLRVWSVMNARSQVVNSDLLVLMNGPRAP